jgi:RimJ/RimL family protein N-acetyltransferase/GrpB-like predicted nucleotidyltransferase (UPF0157 family)
MAELRYADPLLGDEAVLLRPFEDADVHAVAAICSDPEIARWTSVPEPYGEQEARQYLARTVEDRRRGRELSHALVDPGDGTLLGSMGVMVNGEHACGEIGYYLAATARGRGIATRALRLLSRWAIEELGLARIEVLVHPENVASQQVALRAGFQREGLLRSYRDRKGERDDLVMFSLLPAELEAPAVHFVPLAQVAEAVAERRERYRGRLAMLLPEAEVEEFGATTIPGSITKGDLDLLVRVAEGEFNEARAALGDSYSVHQLDNWTPTFASFKSGSDVGIHLVVEGSETDLLLRGSRDALMADPELLERYNALKREHEGADPDVYLRAKAAFFEAL